MLLIPHYQSGFLASTINDMDSIFPPWFRWSRSRERKEKFQFFGCSRSSSSCWVGIQPGQRCWPAPMMMHKDSEDGVEWISNTDNRFSRNSFLILTTPYPVWQISCRWSRIINCRKESGGDIQVRSVFLEDLGYSVVAAENGMDACNLDTRKNRNRWYSVMSPNHC